MATTATIENYTESSEIDKLEGSSSTKDVRGAPDDSQQIESQKSDTLSSKMSDGSDERQRSQSESSTHQSQSRGVEPPETKECIASTSSSGSSSATRFRAKSEFVRAKTQPSTPIDSTSRKILALFNKLTNRNFEIITAQLIGLLQAHEELGLPLLRCTATMIFDKAVEEIFFSEIYSEMCQKISDSINVIFLPYYIKELQTKLVKDSQMARAEAQKLDQIANTDPTAENRLKASQAETKASKAEALAQTPIDPKNKNVFKSVLLSACQTEFERGSHIITQDSLTDYELTEMKGRQKRRMLGNIRFIGELYKKGLVIEVIIQLCIEHLIKQARGPHPSGRPAERDGPSSSKTRESFGRPSQNPSQVNVNSESPSSTKGIGEVGAPETGNDEEIEALCNLIKTTGSTLDLNPRGKTLLNTTFIRIEDLIKSMQFSSRTRFMFLDLKDLRNNNWIVQP
jgi:hypothetical protein